MPFSTDLEVKHGCEAAAFSGQHVEGACSSCRIHDFESDTAPRKRECQFARGENRALAGAEQNEFRFMFEQALEMRYRKLLDGRWSEAIDQSVGRQRNCMGVALITDDDRIAGYLADRRC